MNAHTKIHQAHLDEWACLIADQAASGLTITEWCSQNNISKHKYNYWKHILKESLTDKALPDIVPLSIPTPMSASSCESRDSRELYNSCNSIPQQNPIYPIAITINGIKIEITSTDIAILPDIIKAVRYA